MKLDNPTVQSALIAAIVSIITVVLGFLFRAWYERYFFIFTLESEHRYDQKKKIKEALAHHKTLLLDVGESLNHRLWNFLDNHANNWHSVKDGYYLSSFTYRMLAFFACVSQVESQMVFLDTTIASKDDLNFVKFLRLFSQTMCDVELFTGLGYDASHAKDHFFRNDFIHMSQCFLDKESIITYADFRANTRSASDEALPMFTFLYGMSPDEDRLRWDRLQAFHYVLLMFLNSYGYDFQYTNEQKMHDLLSKQPREIKVTENLRTMLARMHLNNKKEVKKVLKVL